MMMMLQREEAWRQTFFLYPSQLYICHFDHSCYSAPMKWLAIIKLVSYAWAADAAIIASSNYHCLNNIIIIVYVASCIRLAFYCVHITMYGLMGIPDTYQVTHCE